MQSVDTSVLVRLLTRDDPGQTVRAEAFVARGAWVSLVVLAEASWVLTSVYERSPTDVATAVDGLLDHDRLVLQDPDVVRAAVDAFRKRPSVGLSDCLILEIARKAGHVPLGTLDRGLARSNGAEDV